MSFEPTNQLIENVTNAPNAVVTTVNDHGYLTGYVVRVIVPLAYGMNLYDQTTITVTGTKEFITTISTTSQRPFVSPSFMVGGKGCTPAQVVPISGVEENIL